MPQMPFINSIKHITHLGEALNPEHKLGIKRFLNINEIKTIYEVALFKEVCVISSRECSYVED